MNLEGYNLTHKRVYSGLNIISPDFMTAKELRIWTDMNNIFADIIS